MDKKSVAKNSILIIGGTALIFSGVTMMEQTEHIYHGLQMIITGSAMVILDWFIKSDKK